MPSGFASPTAALAAVVECLGTLGDGQRTHIGSAGTGETLDCCDGCLLRVETGLLRPALGPVSMVNLVKCNALVLDIAVIFKTCFSAHTKAGGARPMAELTEEGLALVVQKWETVRALACCAPTNQNLRLVSADDVAPIGNCAGWQLQLEATVAMCGCSAD